MTGPSLRLPLLVQCLSCWDQTPITAHVRPSGARLSTVEFVWLDVFCTAHRGPVRVITTPGFPFVTRTLGGPVHPTPTAPAVAGPRFYLDDAPGLGLLVRDSHRGDRGLYFAGVGWHPTVETLTPRSGPPFLDALNTPDPLDGALALAALIDRPLRHCLTLLEQVAGSSTGYVPLPWSP